MVTRYDLESVVYMIDHTSVNDYAFMKARARMDLDMINYRFQKRMLTEKEQSAAEFAIEILIQLEKKLYQQRGLLTEDFVSRRRFEMSRQFLNAPRYVN